MPTDLAGRPFTIELIIIIRAVAFDAPYHTELYSWLNHVIDAARSERRNQCVWYIYLIVLDGCLTIILVPP